MESPSSQETPAKSPLVRIYICHRGMAAYHPVYGHADVQGNKTISSLITDADLPVWRATLEALRVEVSLREDLLKAKQEGGASHVKAP